MHPNPRVGTHLCSFLHTPIICTHMVSVLFLPPMGPTPSFSSSPSKNQSQERKAEGGLPCGPVVGNLPADAGDMGLIPGPGKPYIPQSN